MNLTAPARQQSALDRMVDREEVLQICYWYQGEGLGEIYSPTLLEPFLNSDSRAIASALLDLEERGMVESVAGPVAGYRLTAAGKTEAGRLFAEGFAGFQKQGHGECDAGCCDGDDHSQCGDECALH